MKTLFALSVLICAGLASAANVKIITPPGVEFKVEMGGESTIKIDATRCKWKLETGPLGNARLTCIVQPASDVKPKSLD